MQQQDEPLTNGSAVIAALLGALSVGCGLLPYFGILALLFALPALGFAIKAWRRSKTTYKPGRALSIAGLAMASIGCILGVLNIGPAWQAGTYQVTEPLLKDMNPVTCAEFDVPDEWNIMYEVVRKPIWVISYEDPDGEVKYAALRYRSQSCRKHPQIAPFLD